MYKVLTLVVISFFSFCTSYGQSNTENQDINQQVIINPDAFILGTLSETLSRFYLIDKETQIDLYSEDEKSIAKYISFFIKQNYKLDSDFVENKNNTISVNQSQLAKRLHNSYFNNEGKFINDKLDTTPKKHSYLLGVYYRYGQNIDENIFIITILNSSKYKDILKVLQEIGCEKIVFKASNSTPKVYEIYFEATPLMIKYFNTLKNEKIQLDFDKNSMEFLNELNNNHSKKKEIKNKKELIKSLNNIFK